MKLLIAGSRSLDSDSVLRDKKKSYIVDDIISILDLFPKTVIHGDCSKGPDSWAKQYCRDFSVREDRYPADWDNLGRGAGHIRNGEMAKVADELLLIWDGVSKGSENMKNRMLKLNKPVYEIIIKTHNIEEEDLI
jgi:hypothetical protein